MTQLDKFLQDYPIHLTEKELAVLRCLVDGDSDKEIARKTGISLAVIRAHLVKSILQKLRARNRTQAAVWGWYHGFGEQQ